MVITGCSRISPESFLGNSLRLGDLRNYASAFDLVRLDPGDFFEPPFFARVNPLPRYPMLRVLVFDDDSSLRNLYATALTQAGYVVAVATTANAALSAFYQDPSDIVSGRSPPAPVILMRSLSLRSAARLTPGSSAVGHAS